MTSSFAGSESAIVRFAPEHRDSFVRLNLAWLQANGLLEPADLEYLNDPQGHILDDGGAIFVALRGADVVGTCAAIRLDDTTYELAKLAVDPSAQGLGLGRALCHAVIEFSRAAGATSVVLTSNHVLETAIRLYESLGFEHEPVPADVRYETADVFMRLPVDPLPRPTYDLVDQAFDEQRSRSVGVDEVLRWYRGLPSGAEILDVGCGTGEPLARALLEAGAALWAIDPSPRMLERFRARFPEVPTELGSIETSRHFGRQFAGVLAWGVMFHLTEDEQERALAQMVGALEPGGELLFTSGHERGMRSNPMHGVVFTFVSLGAPRYREILAGLGCPVIEEFVGSGDNHHYRARRTADPTTHR
jgi:ribosomal protein S18 acetylase RimI-like enzyme/SAM-dependent methyltransferase